MATIVKGDLYYILDGKLCEIKRQLRQREGYPFDPKRLDDALQAIIEGKFEAAGELFPCQIYAADLIPKGWRVAVINSVPQDVAPTEFKVSDLELVSFMKSSKSCVSGKVMRKRAINLKANLGLADAKYILDHQAEIPVEFRNKRIVFPGTLLCTPDGNLHVACLFWHDGRWCLLFYRLAFDWRDHDRLARRK